MEGQLLVLVFEGKFGSEKPLEGTPVTMGGRTDGIHSDEVRRDWVGMGRRVKSSVGDGLEGGEEEGKAGVGSSHMLVAVMRVSMLSGSVEIDDALKMALLLLSL